MTLVGGSLTRIYRRLCGVPRGAELHESGMEDLVPLFVWFCVGLKSTHLAHLSRSSSVTQISIDGLVEVYHHLK